MEPLSPGLGTLALMTIPLTVLFLIFLICRELVLWYFKINIIIAELRQSSTNSYEIYKLLKEFVEWKKSCGTQQVNTSVD